MSAPRWLAAGAFVTASSLLACRAILGIQDWPTDGGANGDAGSDGATSNYNALSDTSKWTTFDLAVLASVAQGYAGGVFDGRYVYLVPSYSTKTDQPFGLVLQYDTQGPSLASSQSWNSFDTKQVNPNAIGFKGATFDGRYVYFIPYEATNPAVITRFDTQGNFGDSSAWSTFDMSTVDPNAGGDYGGAFDGKYMYLVPAKKGIVMRYDTTSSFGVSSSWATFDTANIEIGVSYQGGLFDGNNLYLAAYNGRLAQYDTTHTFDKVAGWQTFDTSSVDLRARGFAGAAFDGRYAYFVPQNNGSDAGFGFDGVVTRYDTQAAFATTSSYSVFDMGQLNGSAVDFNGAAFDGRYVYFVPSNVALEEILVRYDTTQAFTDIGSWESLRLTQILSTVDYMAGAIFDGQYLYFVPSGNGRLLRFQATNTPVTPVNHGSFF